MAPPATTVSTVGDVELVWGESLCWDGARGRLYFVDCATQTLHWLDGLDRADAVPGRAGPPGGLALGALPTGIGLAGPDRLVVCLDDGVTVVDPDRGTLELLAPYPVGMHGRANDMTVDPAGNLVTGTLNLGPGPGSLWWFSAREGWRHLDEGTGNTNGPVVTTLDGAPTLVVGDTVAGVVHAYPYDAAAGSVGPRRVVADLAAAGGTPDGATADADGRVWTCVLRTGTVARLPLGGAPGDEVAVPARNPSDVTFGGPDLDRLYVTSIAVDLGDGPPGDGAGPPGDGAGHLLVVEGLGVTGVPEHRFVL